MEIHKPKAAHSWREFLTEIGTIICGILIALTLEQVIEAWHWREVVAEERLSLKEEVGRLRSAMMGRMELEPCFVNRLADVKEVIHRHDAHEPLGIVGPLGRPLYPPTTKPLWEMAVADQSLAHMKLEEKRRFVDAYAYVSIYDGISGDERAAWRSLQVLNHASELSPSDWSQVRKDYEQAAETHGILASSIRSSWLKRIEAIAPAGAPTSVRNTPPVEAFCAPLIR